MWEVSFLQLEEGNILFFLFLFFFFYIADILFYFFVSEIILFYFYYFIYLHSIYCIPLISPPTVPYPIPPPPCLQEGVPTTTRPPPSLGPQVSGILGTSSPTEARPVSPLLHMCQRVKGARTSPCMLPDWRLSVWELPGIWISWNRWSSYGVALPFSFFNWKGTYLSSWSPAIDTLGLFNAIHPQMYTFHQSYNLTINQD